MQNIISKAEFKPWRDRAVEHGFASIISLPLRVDGKVIGALMILASETDAFDMEEASQLEELTDDLSHRIKNIRGQAEQKLVKAEQSFLAKVIHQASEGVLTFDHDTRVQYLNPAWEEICGVAAKDVVNNTLHKLPCMLRNDDFYQAVKSVVETGKAEEGLYLNQRADGSLFRIEAHISPVATEFSEIIRYVAVIRDVTHEAELEEQLRTAQKLEAIATLAGGIAHDFNNLLAAILTNTELALDDLPEDNQIRDHLEIVYQAGARGKNLVKQITTISRQEIRERQPVSLENIVSECLDLLRASLPATIEIRTEFASGLGLVSADSTQIHQVILNLCTNAADAMRDQNSGVLELRLEEKIVTAGYEAVQMGLKPGAYLKLSVKDNGHGMDAETMGRIFDPFFTTKGAGKGTGLGLSVAHSITRNHGGVLNVESKPGQGTEFALYLAKHYSDKDQPVLNKTIVAASGPKKILFVDDEPALVFAGKKMLEKLGYEVVAGTDGRSALDLFRAEPASFDLMITDQTMPHMTGDMLAREVLKLRSDIPIILCSGNNPSDSYCLPLEKARAIGIRDFLTKPYERSEISQVIHRILN